MSLSAHSSDAPADSEAQLAAFVERFGLAWAAPDLDLHEGLWADDVVLTQPMMGTVVGRRACRQAFTRLFDLVPDLHANVHRWSGSEHELFVEITLTGTFGGREVAWPATDRFVLRDGLIAERRSYFDSMPLLLAILRRPHGWPRVLRCGLWPLFGVRT